MDVAGKYGDASKRYKATPISRITHSGDVDSSPSISIFKTGMKGRIFHLTWGDKGQLFRVAASLVTLSLPR
jgi:hypothetical protein